MYCVYSSIQVIAIIVSHILNLIALDKYATKRGEIQLARVETNFWNDRI